MYIEKLKELINYIEEYLKNNYIKENLNNEEELNKEQILNQILKIISDLIEIVSENYYQEILEGKKDSKLLEFISFLKDFSVQLKRFSKTDNKTDFKENINKLLKFNLIYFKSLL